jgi:hypothetical protein
VSDEPNQFERLNREYHRRAERYAAVAYEEARVTWLLKRFKVARLDRELRTADKRAGGEGRLTLASFNDRFPSFPLLLVASRLNGVKLHTDPGSLLPALFKAFDRNVFVVEYEKFYEEAAPRAGGRAVGLVFPRKGFTQGWCIYDGRVGDDHYRGLTLAYRRGNRELFVRPFQTLVEAVHNAGHGWLPGEEGET